MGNKNRTPYADDVFSVENGTQPEEIQEFVVNRATNPKEIEGLVVWNFNNHMLNVDALEHQADDLLYDEFIVPYQASGVWGYMISLLPDRIREAEILTYNQHRGEYNPYPNFIRHSEVDDNNDVRERIEEHL